MTSYEKLDRWYSPKHGLPTSVKLKVVQDCLTMGKEKAAEVNGVGVSTAYRWFKVATRTNSS